MSIYKYKSDTMIMASVDQKLDNIYQRCFVAKYCTYWDRMVYKNNIHNITLSKIRLLGPYTYTISRTTTHNPNNAIYKHHINTYRVQYNYI